MQLVVMSLPAASLAPSGEDREEPERLGPAARWALGDAQMLALFVEKVVDVKPVLLYLKVVDIQT